MASTLRMQEMTATRIAPDTEDAAPASASRAWSMYFMPVQSAGKTKRKTNDEARRRKRAGSLLMVSYGEQLGTSTGGGSTFTLPFSVLSTVSVGHGLGKYPAVTVMDSADNQVEGDIQYVDLNNLTVTFSAPFSGTVICN
jgi:hypothetical protein